MLQSVFCVFAFHAFLRIGEITVHSRTRSESIVQLGDVTISNTVFVLVTSHFKHNTSGPPASLSISQKDDGYCPVQALYRFLKDWGTFKGGVKHSNNHSPNIITYHLQYI